MTVRELQRLIELHHDTMGECARRLNTNPPELSFVIRGKRRNEELRRALAESLHLPVEKIFDRVWEADTAARRRNEQLG